MTDASQERSASAKLRGLIGRAGPLIDWYRTNKPKVDTLYVTTDEFRLLQLHPAIASTFGFTLMDGSIRYEGFRVLPVGAPAPSINGDGA